MSTLNNFEWFEIKDIKTENHIFINSLSGKCQWNPPDTFEKFSKDQWWELYDFKSNHFYYYNVKSKLKTWLKPDEKTCVSLVQFQILKERSHKTFIDQTTHTDVCNFAKDSRTMNKNRKEIQVHITDATDDVNIMHPRNLPTHSNEIDLEELSLALPGSRKPLPRTNPNCDRKNSSNYRLSQPILFHNDLSFFDLGAESVKSHLTVENSAGYVPESPLSAKSVPGDFQSIGQFPRVSVVNSLEMLMNVNTAIWSSSLFNKSGDQLAGIMSWTQKSIQDSLLAATPKANKKKSCFNFKQIQMYMGDRESDLSKELLALKICRRGISGASWADEIFMQLCKQVTHNPKSEKTYFGWDLICLCLMFFQPESVEMKNCFESFINQYACFDRHIDANQLDKCDFIDKSVNCARIALKLLAKSRKIVTITADDIQEAMKSYSLSTIFYSSLSEVMDIQAASYPNMKLPWIQVALTREILRCNGTQTQGILRIPSEISKIEAIVEAIERKFKSNPNIDPNNQSNSNECDPLLNDILHHLQFDHDPLLLSSVLKYWLRHFRTPLVPFDDKTESLSDIAYDFTKILEKMGKLPEINRLVLKYTIYFLQVLSEPENVASTNMTVESLVTLMAPTLFKLNFSQLQPAMHLLQTLILNLDTSEMVNV